MTKTDIEAIEFILTILYNATENRISIEILKIQLKEYKKIDFDKTLGKSISDLLIAEGLIIKPYISNIGYAFELTQKGKEIIHDFGTYTKFLEHEKEETIKSEKKEQLEMVLAESNIAANLLNVKNSKFNKTATIINIIVGLLNLSLLIWQIIKAGQ